MRKRGSQPRLQPDLPRPVALLDRYNLAQRTLGYPHPITLLLTFLSKISLPTRDFLIPRIEELQSRLPLLHAHVVGPRTRKPRFELNQALWTAEDVLHHAEYDSERDTDLSLVGQEIERVNADRAKSEDDPLWRITLYTSLSSDVAYLALTIDHLITDGMGILNLLQALLLPSLSHVKQMRLEDVPRLEKTISLRPSLQQLIPIAYQELFVPNLPKFLRNRLLPQQPWPAKRILRPGTDCSFAQSVFIIDAPLVQTLKAVSKRHGVRTLHPTLYFAYLAALWAVFLRNNSDHFLACTPRSERSTGLGHCAFTGNYTGILETPVSFSLTSDFWAITRRFSQYLHSQAGIVASRSGMGMLAFLPDPAKASPPGPTGWENFLIEKAASTCPFRESFSFSNLGYTDLPIGASDILFNQTCTPYGQVLAISAVGHKNGIRLASGWMEGCVVSGAEMRVVDEVLDRVLTRLVEDGTGKVTVGELVA